MSRPSALLALAFALPACAGFDPLPAREVATYAPAAFFDTVAVSGAGFSADGERVLFTSDELGVADVWAVTLETGEKERLTRSSGSPNSAISFFPADDRVLFTADEGGDELNHLYVRELDGRVVDVTPGERLKAQFLGWRDDDRAFFAATNERDPRFFDVWRVDVPAPASPEGTATYAKTLVFRNDAGYRPAAVSRSGRYVVLMKSRHNADNDIHLADLTAPGAAPRHVTPHDGDVTHRPATFAPDESAFFFTSDEGDEFQRVWRCDLATGEKEVVFDAGWDVSAFAYTWEGRHLLRAVNDDARTAFSIVDVARGEELDLPLDDVRSAEFSRDESRALLTVSSDTAPPDLYAWDLETDRVTRLTDSLNPAIDARDLVRSEVVRYESFDGLEIPAVLYRPHAASAVAPVPAVVFVHGGPGGQTRQGYRADIQVLANHGYAVLGVNNRGSSGYGKTFHHLDDRRHGEDDLQDCVFGRRHLESLDWVDGDRVAIMGGSYGGYMVCAALTLQPEAFDCGIDVFGVTNWLRTLKSIPPWWEAFRQNLYAEMGDPATDEERLRRISPLFHADRIVRPLLVVQGANDPRVLQVESDEMVAAARANGVDVEYVVFDDEGHGFRRRENRVTAAEAYVRFLDRHLKGAGATP
ncbi:MAG: alpha/beta fold hydrolase [Planctomycetota bacterium JB042]